jgi:ubiquinone biosynthesis protein
MRGPHNLWRLIRTGATFERTGAMREVLVAMNAPPRLRLLARVLGWPWAWLGLKGDPALPPVTRALTALGPAYIKFGQLLSTRPDIVGDELATSCATCRTSCRPSRLAEARAMVEAELGQPVDALFSEFSEPVAAASIAQVHRARRRHRPGRGGQGAAPGDRARLPPRHRRLLPGRRDDRTAAAEDAPAAPDGRDRAFRERGSGRAGPAAGDRRRGRVRGQYRKGCGLSVPRPLWDLSARSVMTLGWAEGVPLGDNAAIDALGVDRKELGERVLRLFLSHALRDGYFHADMHQGNLKVAAERRPHRL